MKSSYGWKPGDDTILRISKSSLGTLKWCPQQYVFEYIQYIRGETNEDMIRGTNVHNALEAFYPNVEPILEDIIETADEGNHHMALDMLRGAFPGPTECERDENDPFIKAGVWGYGESEILDNLAEDELSRLLKTEGRNFLPVGNETLVEAWEDIEVKGQIVKVHYKGFIDRIFKARGGGYALMELKTGKWKDSKTSPMRQEMAFYAHMLSLPTCTVPEFANITHWGWRFPRTPYTHYEPIKKVSISAMKKRLEVLVRSHLEQDFQPKADPFKCSWCSHMPLCPAWTEEVIIDV